MKQNIDVVLEALTSSVAKKNIDNERLEFYGDAILNFFVVLEFFTCDKSNSNEKDIDFFRIKTVSNQNLSNVNKRHELY